jgi:hypothetical protein
MDAGTSTIATDEVAVGYKLVFGGKWSELRLFYILSVEMIDRFVIDISRRVSFQKKARHSGSSQPPTTTTQNQIQIRQPSNPTLGHNDRKPKHGNKLVKS